METTGKIVKRYYGKKTSGRIGEPVEVWEVDPDYGKIDIEKILSDIGLQRRVRVVIERLD